MHIHFKQIRLKRFRSFQDEAILSFDSAGIGLYFLKGKNNFQPALGSNGSGKSSLLDSLMWCLYGKTVQGLKNPDVVPWTGKGTTEVEVTVLVDKQEHVVRRTIGPNLLTIDGKEVAQEHVAELIPIPLEVIPYTVILGQRQPLFFDLTAGEKLKIFSESLDLERWEHRSTHAAELVKNLESEINQKEIEIAGWKIQENTTLLDIEESKAKSQEWEEKRTAALEDKEQQKKDIQKKLIPLNKQRDDADLKLDRAETELRAMNAQLTKLQSEKYELGRASTRADSKYHSLYLDKQRLEKESEIIDEGTCPTCKQPLKSHKKTLQADITKQAKELDVDIKAAVEASKQALTAFEASEKAADLQLEARDQFEVEANEARNVLDQLTPTIAKFEAAIKMLDKMFEEYEGQNNPYKDQIQTLRRRKDALKQQIEQGNESVEKKKEYCERVRPWIRWFKDIKLYTLDEILQELQITTNNLLEEFSLAGWKVHYDVERETKSKTIARGLNIEILSPTNTKAVKWEVWSGGESQRLKLIGSAALSSVLLNHLGVTTNLAFFDEPTQGLGKEGIDDLVELLANYAKDTRKNLWMIDHHAFEGSKFKQVIQVTKDKSGSKIIE